jgi:hypothetical protein
MAAPGAAPRDVEYRFTRDEADTTMDRFARCLVFSHWRHVAAEHYVRAIPDGPAFMEAGGRLATPDCVPRSPNYRIEMRFKPNLLRAALFGALYQRDFWRPPAHEITVVAPLQIAAEFDGPAEDIPKAVIFQRVIGDCTARAAPGEVHVLLMSRVASGGEKEALDRIMPHLAGCLPAGHRMAFSRPVLRGLLAEALYKLRKAASPQPGGNVRGSRS